MSRTKDQCIERTGGFRFGESGEDFANRAELIARLTRELLATGQTMEERERIRRRLCDLQGIDFDAPDWDDD